MGAANVRTVCRAIRSLAGVEDMAVPKVSIDDYDALEDLLFVDVEEYLIATGWKMIRPLAESHPNGGLREGRQGRCWSAGARSSPTGLCGSARS